MKVEAVMGSPFVFNVSSRSRPAHFHVVNWLDVTCSCETFSYKNRQHNQATGQNYVCSHMIAAKEHCWNEILEHTREELLAQ